MREVTVKTKELLELIQANRQAHIDEYEEACAGYKSKALAWLDTLADKVRAEINSMKEGELHQVSAFMFGLPVPESHESDYNRALKMLAMSVDETVTLPAQEFSQYAMDDWQWKANWTMSNTRYK